MNFVRCDDCYAWHILKAEHKRAVLQVQEQKRLIALTRQAERELSQQRHEQEYNLQLLRDEERRKARPKSAFQDAGDTNSHRKKKKEEKKRKKSKKSKKSSKRTSGSDSDSSSGSGSDGGSSDDEE